jgi:hypothetical protein
VTNALAYSLQKKKFYDSDTSIQRSEKLQTSFSKKNFFFNRKSGNCRKFCCFLNLISLILFELFGGLDIGQPAHRPTCPLANLPISQPAHRPTCPLANLPIGQPAHWPTCPLANLPISQPAH